MSKMHLKSLSLSLSFTYLFSVSFLLWCPTLHPRGATLVAVTTAAGVALHLPGTVVPERNLVQLVFGDFELGLTPLIGRSR